MLIVSHILYLRVLRVVTSQCECKEHSDKHDLQVFGTGVCWGGGVPLNEGEDLGNSRSGLH